ncbi:MAG: type II toxin-antitoxin system prevent-host-death family antitoxin [Lentisphaerae bacterium]|jgi:prevent-host-death family protein|nr:type II toxin-antitoxin system prevent-host-death family antitoxin [Lentisphaerota bacterium]
MKTVSIHEAKARLSSLIAWVESSNEQVVISRYGRAVARIAPIRRGKRTAPDSLLSQVKIHEDLTSPTGEEWENV